MPACHKPLFGFTATGFVEKALDNSRSTIYADVPQAQTFAMGLPFNSWAVQSVARKACCMILLHALRTVQMLSVDQDTPFPIAASLMRLSSSSLGGAEGG